MTPLRPVKDQTLIGVQEKWTRRAMRGAADSAGMERNCR